MRQAVIVIGSNYGDEGKGLASYCAVKELGAPCLNILINGGPQRGHTVDLADGRRHVFHHFGAGSAAGAASYMDADFMVNPMVFEQERELLQAEIPEANLSSIVDAQCRVTLPYDMMLNQIFEDARGHQRHGSCGMGVYETRLRYESTDWALRWQALAQLSKTDFTAYCRRIAGEYVPERLSREGLAYPAEWDSLLDSDGLIEHTWDDLQCMRAHTRTVTDWEDAAQGYPSLVFEAAQGLALDEDNLADSPHLTPSHTTSLISARRIAALNEPCRTEIRYVTRAYFTRHGAGPLPTACSMAEISPDITDRTNMPNPYQQTIRYGRFDGEALRRRVFADLQVSRHILPDAHSAIIVTHLNETSGRLHGSMTLESLAEGFDRLCLSDRPDRI